MKLNKDAIYTVKDVTIVIVTIIMVITAGVLVGYASTIPQPRSQTLEFKVWDAQAPFGHYWVQPQGSGNLLFYRQTSNLQETYVIKFIDSDGILRTVMLPSTWPNLNVHLTDNSSVMKIVVTTPPGVYDRQGWTDNDKTVWDLYVPDPKLLDNG
jgi:hypothetical protein